jgi:hypothetical protein
MLGIVEASSLPLQIMDAGIRPGWADNPLLYWSCCVDWFHRLVAEFWKHPKFISASYYNRRLVKRFGWWLYYWIINSLEQNCKIVGKFHDQLGFSRTPLAPWNYLYDFRNLISDIKKLRVTEIYKTVILPVKYGCETWSVTLREEHRLRFFWKQSVEEDSWTYKGGRQIMGKIA